MQDHAKAHTDSIRPEQRHSASFAANFPECDAAGRDGEGAVFPSEDAQAAPLF